MNLGINIKSILEKSNLKEAELILFLEDNPFWKNTIETVEIVDDVIQMKKGSRTNEFSFSKFLSKISKEEGTVEITEAFRSIQDLHNYKKPKKKNSVVSEKTHPVSIQLGNKIPNAVPPKNVSNESLHNFVKEHGTNLPAKFIKTIELLTEVLGHNCQNLGRACENLATLSLKPDETDNAPMVWKDVIKISMKTDSGHTLNILKGKDIITAYSDNKGGVASCMTSARRQLKFYAKLPNKVRLVCVRTAKGVVKGRALLWHLDNGDVYMDRRYYDTKDSDTTTLFNAFTSETKIIYRKADSSYSFFRDAVEYTAPMVLNVEINFAILQMPYLDTFTYNGNQDNYDDEGNEEEESDDNSEVSMSDNEIFTLRTQASYRGNYTPIDIFHSYYNQQMALEAFMLSLKTEAANNRNRNPNPINSRFVYLVLEKNPELLEAIFENLDGYTIADLMVFHPKYIEYLNLVKSQKVGRFLDHSVKYNDYTLFSKLNKKIFETKDFLNMMTRNIRQLDIKKLLSYKCCVSALNRMSNKGKSKFAINYTNTRPLTGGIDINHILLYENIISQLTDENLENYYKVTKSEKDWEKIFSPENEEMVNKIRKENITIFFKKKEEKKLKKEKPRNFMDKISNAMDIFNKKEKVENTEETDDETIVYEFEPNQEEE